MRAAIKSLILIGTLGFSGVAFCQDAVITFFAPGSMWKAVGHGEMMAGIGSRQIPFQGWVFSDGDNIAHMRSRHFVSFHVTPGPHTFSASWNKAHPEEKASLTLDINPAGQYFIFVGGEEKGALIIQLLRSSIAPVNCSEAFAVASGFKALSAGAVDKDARAHLVDSVYFPKCN